MSDKKVTYQLLRNDMFWSIYCCETLRWTGYNDSNWWDNVARKHMEKGTNLRECSKCNKKWRISYNTNEAEEVKP